jgi:hypothetical protein
MNDWILCIIFVTVGIFMIVGGRYLVVDWNKRIKAWDSPPTTSEYFGCLFQGWIGVFGAILGGTLLLLGVIASICLII